MIDRLGDEPSVRLPRRPGAVGQAAKEITAYAATDPRVAARPTRRITQALLG
ncbi:hypothetical protein [Streptomyces fumanus]|uniref:hypothetical protein n=1 Tax=Streptomyces fumanus TaxID=67302 RepID=UPI0033DF4304